jgi:hypothetical protein
MKKYIFPIISIFVFISNYAQVGVGTTTPNSTLTVQGSVATKVDVFTFPITLDENNHTVLGNNNTTITLPDPTNIIGREYIIKTDATGAIVSAQPGDLIDGSTNPLTLNSFESVTVKAVSTGVWLIMGGKFIDNGAEEINDLSDAKTTSNGDVYLGLGSGFIGSGLGNTAVGQSSLLNASGNNNVAMGLSAGAQIGIGNNNIFLGHRAGVGSQAIIAGDENIMIGNNAVASSGTVSGELNIGDAIYATSLYGTPAKVGIGNGNRAPTSTLSVNGSLSMPIRVGTVNTPYTLTDTDFTYVTNGNSNNSADVTLPSAVGKAGRIYIIKSAGGNSQDLLTTGGQTIDGGATYDLNRNGRVTTVQSDGANWWVISTR